MDTTVHFFSSLSESGLLSMLPLPFTNDEGTAFMRFKRGDLALVIEQDDNTVVAKLGFTAPAPADETSDVEVIITMTWLHIVDPPQWTIKLGRESLDDDMRKFFTSVMTRAEMGEDNRWEMENDEGFRHLAMLANIFLSFGRSDPEAE